jgi:hypothetical protein
VGFAPWTGERQFQHDAIMDELGGEFLAAALHADEAVTDHRFERA